MKLQEVVLQHDPKEVSYTIFCDLDGVLANFKKEMHRVLGSFGDNVEYSDDEYARDPKYRKRMWTSIGAYQKAHGPVIWRNLELMPDAMELWNYIKDKNVQILTASGQDKYDAKQQKRAWVTEHFGSAVRINFVMAGPMKAQYAGPNNILIDDQARNIGPFNEAGGIGILHTSAASTIAKLKEIGA